MKKSVLIILLCMLTCVMEAADFDYTKIKNRISEFELGNGLKFILLEDHSIPIATFMTCANVGGSDERIGIYGVSHFLEHLAFKGTSEIGVNNYKEEQIILSEMDAVYEKIIVEKEKVNSNIQNIKKWQQELKDLMGKAGVYIISNEYTTILKRHGAVDVNAETNSDFTLYTVTLPSNKLELWANLESQRFSDPVFREFYKEKEIIKEERMMRVESSPVRKLIEEFQAIAFKDHPYRVSAIGPMSNIDHIQRSEVMTFFARNYGAKNMIVGVAGDISRKELKKFARQYFSKIPPGIKNRGVFTTEPLQEGTREVTLYKKSQPWLVMGYHIPSYSHPDYDGFEVLNYLLTSGRNARLYKKLVVEKRIALDIVSYIGFPGKKYPCLYLFLTVPNEGHSNDQLETSILQEIERLQREPVPEEELLAAKRRVKLLFYKQMKSPESLLRLLLMSQIFSGSWQCFFEKLHQLEKVTPEYIMNLVNKYLVKNNLVIGRIENKVEVRK